MKFLISLFISLLALPSLAEDAAVQISVDTGKTFQVMQGFGSSALPPDHWHMWSSNQGTISPRLSSEQREELFKLVYKELGFTRMRFDWGQNRQEMDQYIDYVQQALRTGADTYFLSPRDLGKGMNESNPEEYVKHALGVIQYWKSKGLEIPYYSIVNEPGYTRSGIISKEYLRTVVKLLGQRLREAGLLTQLVIPDDWTAGEAYKRSSYILADPEARKYVGALAYHLYNENSEDVRKMAALSQAYKIPVWMTEFSDPRYTGPNGGLNWALSIHDLIVNGNVSAVDYMWPFFGEYSERKWPGNTLIVLKSDANGLHYKGYQLNSMYQAMGQYSRYVRPGYTRIAGDSSDRQIKVSAFKKSSAVVLVIINEAATDRQIDITLRGAPGIHTLEVVQGGNGQGWKTLASLRKANNRFLRTLPPKSITTLIGNES